MEAYTAFAGVYDSFMSHIPYEKWADNIHRYLKNNNIGTKILELGCGTGRFTLLMEEKGYKMTGIDNSIEMIKSARKKKSKSDFILQDMRAIELEESFDGVISVCDSMNYLSEEFDLESVFMGVSGVIKPGGIFIFDLKTEKFYKELGENVYTDDNEFGSYIWKNSYDEDTRDNYYELTFFIHKKKDLYVKRTEEHVQHVFLEDEIKKCAEKTGFLIKAVLDESMEVTGNADSQRIYYILERK